MEWNRYLTKGHVRRHRDTYKAHTDNKTCKYMHIYAWPQVFTQTCTFTKPNQQSEHSQYKREINKHLAGCQREVIFPTKVHVYLCIQGCFRWQKYLQQNSVGKQRTGGSCFISSEDILKFHLQMKYDQVALTFLASDPSCYMWFITWNIRLDSN